MKMYFENNRGMRKLLKETEDEHEARKAMMDFCRDHDFKVYYTNEYTENNETHIDVGSHTEFFILEK